MCDSRLDGLERTVGADPLGVGVVGRERRGCDDGLTHLILPQSGWKLLTLVVLRYNNIFCSIMQYLRPYSSMLFFFQKNSQLPKRPKPFTELL